MSGDANRTRFITLAGALLLMVGVGLFVLGLLETSCFGLFSVVGPFHYEGFGPGSLMFAVITAQVVGYCLVGALLAVIGYGHLRRRRWARILVLVSLWSWLVVGLPVVVAALFVLAGTKDLSPAGGATALVGLGLAYLVLPPLLIQVYRSDGVRRVFEVADASARHRIWDLPLPILVVGFLYALLTLMLASLLLFNGIFPVFGRFATGLPGMALIATSMACLLFLAWGTLRRRPWAWWGSVVFQGVLTLSTVLTLGGSDLQAIVSLLPFAPVEAASLSRVPAEGYQLAILAGLPLTATWVLAVLSRRAFRFN